MKNKQSTRKSHPMTDDQMYQILESFANHHPCLRNGRIVIHVNGYSYKADNEETEGMLFEDAKQLDHDIHGAERFMLWLRRNNLALVRRK